MRLKYLLPILLAAGLSTAALANPYETTLNNGLRVIVKEDRRAPTAVQMVWYRIGSMDEVDGQSGVAHVLEHMMFKGTPEVGPGEFNRRVAAAGGRKRRAGSAQALLARTPVQRPGQDPGSTGRQAEVDFLPRQGR